MGRGGYGLLNFFRLHVSLDDQYIVFKGDVFHTIHAFQLFQVYFVFLIYFVSKDHRDLQYMNIYSYIHMIID